MRNLFGRRLGVEEDSKALSKPGAKEDDPEDGAELGELEATQHRWRREPIIWPKTAAISDSQSRILVEECQSQSYRIVSN